MVEIRTNRKPTDDFPIPFNTKFGCCLAAILMSSFDPHFDSPVWAVRVDLGKIEISSPHSYWTSIHTIGLSCIQFGHNTQRGRRPTDRQTERSERAAYAKA